MTVTDFWRLCSILSRRRYVVLTALGISLFLVALGCLLLPRYYKASVLVMPSDQALRRSVISGAVVLAMQPSPEPSSIDIEERAQQLANLIYLAQSQTVLERARQQLSLPMSTEQLQKQLTVEPLPSTSMLRISMMMRQAEESIYAANAIASIFVSYYHELSQREALKNRRFLEEELTKSQGQLRQAEAELAGFKAQTAATPLEERTLPQTPVDLEWESTEAQRREMSAKASAIRHQLASVPETVVMATGSTDNPVVTELQRQLVQLETELAAEVAIHQEKHPNVVVLRARVEDLRGRLQQQMARVITSTTVTRNPLHIRLLDNLADYEAQRVALGAKASALRQLASRGQVERRQQSALGVTLAALTREFRVAEQAYTRLKTALDQARLDENLSGNADTIKVVDPATTALGPMTKTASPLQLFILGVVLSLALSVGIALAMETLDNRVQTTVDAERLLQLPVSGVIPEIGGYTPLQLPQVSYLAPVSAYAEAYRFLRTDLLFEQRDKPLQTIMVATARPGQGGTTTICNLAISLAEAGKRVILVDADLRRPSLHRIFGVDNSAGLTSVLLGQAELVAALRPTRMENLLLMPAGPSAPNPSLLVNSPQLRELINRLRQECDFVLFDTPSAIAFSDAAVLSSILDGVLLVVRAQQAPRGTELQVRQLLNKAGATVIGVVLNDVPQSNVDSMRYHEHYYPARHELAAPVQVAPALPAAEEAVQAAPEPEPTQPDPAEEAAPAQAVAAPGWRLAATWLQAGAVLAAVALGGYLLMAKPQPASRPSQAPALTAASPVVVVGRVSRQTWVRVTTDGKLSYEGELLPGRNQWQGEQEVTVHVADPQAIEFTWNGRRVGKLDSAAGEPAVRTFTRTAGGAG